MNMQQKRAARAKKKNEQVKSETNQTNKSNINWFPGHMTRAKREMEANLQKVDMVIEIRDCRVPLASANPMLNEIIKNKPRLIILSKKDKGEMIEIEKWIRHLSNEVTHVIAMDILQENVPQKTNQACQTLMKPMIDRMIRKGIKPRPIRAMVVGIPNVGKSTFINRVAKKKAAKTSDRPGVTRSLQWVKCENVELLDTPGVLWPKFEDEIVGMNLALTGAIRDEILILEDIVVYGLKILVKKYPERIEKRYGIEVKDNVYELIDDIARKKLWLKSKNEIDYERCFKMILNEIRDDKLGGITWEYVDESPAGE